jgi:hypothetical protein
MPEKKSLNKNLHKANKAKNDEFYTQLTDIEKELKNYKEHLKGKVVFCNCDDPEESHFFRYFAMNFDHLWLKKLIATHYDSEKPTYKLEIDRKLDVNQDDKLDFRDIVRTPLSWNWDFRSPECIEILEESDIVVTNPPFSLFREYVGQLFKYNKRFIIVWNQNAVTYKETFELIKENKIWLGVDNAGTKWFEVPDHYEIATETRIKVVDWKKFFSMGSVMWFTNLDHKKRHEDIILYKMYNRDDYPKYDNYEIINIDKVNDIPLNFSGLMGVPITFLDKYNPDQFEILGIANSARWIGIECYTLIDGRKIYNRIIIRNKKPIS